MHGWGCIERPIAALVFASDKSNEHAVHEAIFQTSEYLNSECHDNKQAKHMKKNQLSFKFS
jgi:hypothetical protein